MAGGRHKQHGFTTARICRRVGTRLRGHCLSARREQQHKRHALADREEQGGTREANLASMAGAVCNVTAGVTRVSRPRHAEPIRCAGALVVRLTGHPPLDSGAHLASENICR